MLWSKTTFNFNLYLKPQHLQRHMHRVLSTYALSVKCTDQKVFLRMHIQHHLKCYHWYLHFMMSPCCLVKISSKPNSSWNIYFSVILVYLVLILTSDHNFTACQVGGESSTNREQLNKLPLCCQVLGRRKRHSSLKKELKPLLQRPRKPRGWGVRGEEEERMKSEGG